MSANPFAAPWLAGQGIEHPLKADLLNWYLHNYAYCPIGRSVDIAINEVHKFGNVLYKDEFDTAHNADLDGETFSAPKLYRRVRGVMYAINQLRKYKAAEEDGADLETSTRRKFGSTWYSRETGDKILHVQMVNFMRMSNEISDGSSERPIDVYWTARNAEKEVKEAEWLEFQESILSRGLYYGLTRSSQANLIQDNTPQVTSNSSDPKGKGKALQVRTPNNGETSIIVLETEIIPSFPVPLNPASSEFKPCNTVLISAKDRPQSAKNGESSQIQTQTGRELSATPEESPDLLFSLLTDVSPPLGLAGPVSEEIASADQIKIAAVQVPEVAAIHQPAVAVAIIQQPGASNTGSVLDDPDWGYWTDDELFIPHLGSRPIHRTFSHKLHRPRSDCSSSSSSDSDSDPDWNNNTSEAEAECCVSNCNHDISNSEPEPRSESASDDDDGNYWPLYIPVPAITGLAMDSWRCLDCGYIYPPFVRPEDTTFIAVSTSYRPLPCLDEDVESEVDDDEDGMTEPNIYDGSMGGLGIDFYGSTLDALKAADDSLLDAVDPSVAYLWPLGVKATDNSLLDRVDSATSFSLPLAIPALDRFMTFWSNLS